VAVGANNATDIRESDAGEFLDQLFCVGIGFVSLAVPAPLDLSGDFGFRKFSLAMARAVLEQ
jgi:hypothetical protein